jgi:Na+/melibiose symporter-like transporter
MTDFQTFLWLVSFVMLFRLFHSFFMVPAGALTPELAPEYHDRTVLIGYRWMLGACGNALTAILVWGIFFRDTAQFPQGQLNPASYPKVAVWIGLFITATILVSTWGTHSRIKGLHKPPVDNAGFLASLKSASVIFKNPNFLVALTAGALGATSTALAAGLTVYFSTYMFELPARSIMVLILTLLISGPAAFVVAPAVSRALGKKRACMLLFFLSVAFNHGPILSRLAGILPENGSPLLLPILMACSTMAAILGMSGSINVGSMIADIVEETQVKSGVRAEGLLFSTDQLLNKIVSAFATILPGVLIAMVGFPEGAKPGQLDPSIMRNLALLYVPTAATLSLVSISTWAFYKIDQATHERNLATLREAATPPVAGE